MSHLQKITVFLLLVFVQTFAMLLFKICQINNKYTFNPASSVALTEICKLFIAFVSHWRHCMKNGEIFFADIESLMVINYFGLSALYTLNNLLSFYCLSIADPGSMALGKSIAPYLCAVLLRFKRQEISEIKWICIIVQCCAIAITQYDACKGTSYLPVKAYYLIGAATSLTAFTSVWNQLVLKGYEVPVNLQNFILYGFGSIIAIALYVYSVHDSKHSEKHIGFFEGYTMLSILLIISQAFHGIAVALVYKYADAIVKNFANSSTMAILVIISSYFFNLQTTLHSWLSIVIVITATYCYMIIAISSDTLKLQEKNDESSNLIESNKMNP